MKVEVGQFWRMNSNKSTYYVYKIESWTSPAVGWVSVDKEPTGGKLHVATSLERVGPPDPDFFPHWKETKDVLEEHYHLITDEEEIGMLHLQRLAWNEGCRGAA